MINITVGEFKDKLSGILNGLNVDEDVNDIDGVLERAVGSMLMEINIPEASGRESITLYDGVFDYEAPDNIFGKSLTDFRPQGITRNESDKAYKRNIELFDRTKHILPNGYKIAFEYDRGTPIMRVATPKPTGKVEIDTLDDDDWTLSGSASGLAVDRNVYYESPNSLRFTLTGASTGILTKTIDSLDIDEYEDLGVAFLAIYIPDDAVTLSSIELRLGSSASAYDSVTATAGFLGDFEVNKWILVPFDFSLSTSTGTPDWSAIDYAQIRLTTTGSVTNFRIGKLFMSLPSPHEVLFESTAVFKAEGEVPTKEITSDEDIIVLADPAYRVYEKVAALEIAKEVGGASRKQKIIDLEGDLYGTANKVGLYARYREENPPERIKQDNTYYNLRGFSNK